MNAILWALWGGRSCKRHAPEQRGDKLMVLLPIQQLDVVGI